MKRLGKTTILCAIFLLFFVNIAQPAEFWGSIKTNKYHYPSCKKAKKIKPLHLVIFTSPEDAIKAGYIPCKVCKPPVSNKK